MGPPSYMWSVADQNIGMRCVTIEWRQSNRKTRIIKDINAEVKHTRQRRWKYYTKWQNFWNHCFQPEGDYYQADEYEFQKHTDSYLPPKLYCDYFIWCVSGTVMVLNCFVMCGCVYVGVL